MESKISAQLDKKPERGASQKAIEFHYDRGVDFFRPWLGRTLIYTAGLWDNDDSSNLNNLSMAQQRKVLYHLDAIKADAECRILDIGCGWGGMLLSALELKRAKVAQGITLSRGQAEYITSQGCSDLRVIYGSYLTAEIEEKFDGIWTVGALEHFAKPDIGYKEKLQVYSKYFQLCSNWLREGGRLSIQTITWADRIFGREHHYRSNDIFPETDTPFVGELIESSKKAFELVSLREDTDDYIYTLQSWQNLFRDHFFLNRTKDDQILFFDRYFRRALAGFRRRRKLLYRLTFRKKRCYV